MKLEGIYVVVPLGDNRFRVSKEREKQSPREATQAPPTLRVLAAIGRRAKHLGASWAEIAASCRRIGTVAYLRQILNTLVEEGLIEARYSNLQLATAWHLTEKGLALLQAQQTGA